MDYIRDYLSTVLHLPLLLPCFAVFPVRFFVSRLVIAHTDAIRAKFYWRKRITFFSKNTFNPICSTQAKKTFSCSLDSKFPLVSQGGACSRTNWPIQPELIPVPLGWKDKENYVARLDGSFLQQNQFHFENWMRSTIPHAMLSIKLPRLPLNSHQYLLITFPLAWLFAFCTLWASCTQLSNIRRNNFFSDPSAMCMALLFNTLASVRKGKRKRLKLCPHVTYMF